MRVAEPAIVKENQICDGKTDIIGCHPNRDLSFDWSRSTLIPELFLQWQNLWRGSLGMMMGAVVTWPNMGSHGVSHAAIGTQANVGFIAHPLRWHRRNTSITLI